MDSDRRSDQRALIKSIVQDAIRDERSFRRNGHTWAQWFEKIVTPQNVLLAIIVVFQFGGKVQRFDTDLSTQQERTRVMQAQHEEINRQIADIILLMKKSDAALSETRAQLDELRRSANQRAAAMTVLSDQVHQAVKRNEFNAAVNQTIVPKLERIEEKVNTP